MKKKWMLIGLSGAMYAIVIVLVSIFIFSPGIAKIKESNSIKELSYEEKTELIDEVNKKYIDLENKVKEKYAPSISAIDEKYEKLSQEIKVKYDKEEKEINNEINDNQIAKSKEFFANGFSKKYYELQDKLSDLQDEKWDLDSKERTELSSLEKTKKNELSTIESDKSSELNRLSTNKSNEINKINNQNNNKSSYKIKGIFKIVLGIVILLIPVLYIVAIYNGLVFLLNSVKEKWSQIDVLLKQRADLIPNIVAVVKGYAKHEKGTFSEVTKARNKVINSTTKEEEIQTNKRLTDQVSKLLFLQEDYPELKANENFISLQDDLREVEDNISLCRLEYNKAVLIYKNKLEMFPSNIIADLFDFKPEVFFEIEEDEKENPNINL